MFRGVRRLLSAVCVLTLACVIVVTLTGCNAIKGVGRDIEALGQGGQDLIDGKK